MREVRRRHEAAGTAAAAIALAAGLVGCSSSSGSGTPEVTGQSSSAATSAAASTTALPLGDGHVTMTGPRSGDVWSCQPPNPNGPAAQAVGPWISGHTWDPAKKPHVAGNVTWPNARFTVRTRGTTRVITGNRLPVHEPTGHFPIAGSDPVSQYDRNPNSIVAAKVRITLPTHPKAAKKPSCLGFGGIGVMNDGVILFDALDAQGRDAVAHEVLDRCGGHPAPGGIYHHHDVPPCLMATAHGPATLVGYAFDGYGIYVELVNGQLPTNADLDACHGRTSVVPWDGRPTRIYHYDATLAYPYTLGCYHGTPAISNNGPPPGPPSGPPPTP